MLDVRGVVLIAVLQCLESQRVLPQPELGLAIGLQLLLLSKLLCGDAGLALLGELEPSLLKVASLLSLESLKEADPKAGKPGRLTWPWHRCTAR